MAINVTKLADASVTDVLIKAMERAATMKNVVVVYETIEGEESSGGVLVNEESTVAQINWMIDQAKRWLFQD